MKVDLDKLVLGHSPLSDSIFVGIPSKDNHKWLHKKDVSNHFIHCVIQRWEGQKEIISAGDESWEISVKKLKKPKE